MACSKPERKRRPRDTYALRLEPDAFAKETKAAQALAEVQRIALNPVGGWWEKKPIGVARGAWRRTHPDRLRAAAVHDAYSVGCTRAQICRASGANENQIARALSTLGIRRSRGALVEKST